MGRIIVAFMKKKGLVIILLLLVFGCQKNDNKKFITNFIPENANLIIEITSFERFKSAIRNNEILSKSPLKSILEKRLGPLDSLKISGTLLICAHEENNVQNFTFISEQNNIRPNNYFEANQVIKDSIWMVSDQANLISKKFNTLHSFVKYRELADANSTMSIYSNSKQAFAWNNAFLNVHVSPENISLNGILLDHKTTKTINSLFEANATKPQRINNIAPENLVTIKSYNLHDFSSFAKNLKAKDSTLVFTNFTQSLFETFNEIGWLETLEGHGFVAQSIDIGTTNEALIGYKSILETYRSVPIFEFDNPDFLTNTFGDLLPKINTKLYTVLDDFIIFSDKNNFLKDIISNYQSNNILPNNEAYQNLLKQLSDEVTFQNTFDTKTLSTLLNATLKTNFKPNDLKNYSHTTYQLIKDDEVIHFNALVQKNKASGKSKKVREEFNLVLDADIAGDIQFVHNHSTNQKDIIVQDVENQLYLISNKGVVLWKRRLNGPILGHIQQIDAFKNGRLQMVFATPKRLYLIDRLGHDVGPFPLKFEDNITLPLAVFDYDNSKNYRFIVTQNNALLMYDKLGKRVSGFKYNPKSKIQKSPKHIRHLGKDYIVFNEGKNLQILNRRGEIRVSVKETIDFSNQPIYLYNNQFSTLDTKGDLVQIDMKGRVSRQVLGFTPETQIVASNETLVAQWENNLQIKNNKIELDFGRMTPPQLFYQNNTTYISITDSDSNNVWFYNNQGEVLAGFPVYGMSKIDLTNADNDSAPEFVCQSSSSGIIMYQLY